MNKLSVKSTLSIITIMILILISTLFTINTSFKSELLNQYKISNVKLVNAYAKSLDLDNPQKLIDTISKENDKLAYALFINTDLSTVASSENKIGEVLSDQGSIECAKNGKPFSGYFNYNGQDCLDVLTPIYSNGKLMGALNIGIKIDSTSLNNAISGTLILVTTVMIVISFLGIVLLWILTNLFILNPIAQCRKLINDEDHIPPKSHDEMSILFTSILDYKTRLRTTQLSSKQLSTELHSSIQEISACLEELSAQATVVIEANAQIGTAIEGSAIENVNLSTFFKTFIQSFDNMVVQVDKSSNLISNIGELIDDGNNNMNNLIKYTDESKELSQIVSGVLNKLNYTSTESLKLIKNISDISSTVKLLGLNASIESAKSGIYGAGFSVIAQEITKLANESSTTSELISNSLLTINNIVLDTLEEMQKVGICVGNQTTSILNTKSILDKITLCESDISKSMDILLESLDNVKNLQTQIDDSITYNTATVEEITASIQETVSSLNEVGEALNSVTINVCEVAQVAEKLNEME